MSILELLFVLVIVVLAFGLYVSLMSTMAGIRNKKAEKENKRVDDEES